MSLDLAALYLADPDSLSKDDILALRSALAGASGINDVDSSPNTPFGDLMTSPSAMQLALMQESWRRFFSDMDLENTANGETYNCDFVKSYLDQFGLFDNGEARKSYGLVRLEFEDSVTRLLERSTTFINGTDQFVPRLPYDGGLTILNPGEAAPVSGNYARLTPIGEDRWVVDILIQGDAGVELEAATTLSIDRDIDLLESVTVLDGYQSGAAPTGLSELARRSRFNTHSHSPNTRGGAISHINNMLPGVTTLGVLVSGDPELTRDAVNLGSVAAGNMDILVRGDLLITESINVRVNYIDTGSGSKFIGEAILPEVPIIIDEISYEETAITDPDIISVSRDPSAYPALSASYGSKERIFLEFDMPLVGGSPAVTTSVDESGLNPIEYANFVVTYRYDPSRKIVEDLMGGDHAPVGLNTYVRYFTPIDVTALNVLYNRKAGVRMALATARAELLESLNRHTFHTPTGAPDVIDSMRYAGAHSIEDLELEAVIRFSCADYVYTGSVEPDEVLDPASYAAFKALVSLVDHPGLTDFYAPAFTQTADAGQFGASGPRSVSWLVESDNLLFSEQKTLG